MRDEFWDTAPHYGGQKEIWDALRVASESEVSHAQAIVESAGIIVSNADLTLCYDERGAKYELPKYVLSEPTNLIRDSWRAAVERPSDVKNCKWLQMLNQSLLECPGNWSMLDADFKLALVTLRKRLFCC